MTRRKGIQTLTERQRHALELYISGHNTVEIAREQGCTSQVAGRRLRRALEIHRATDEQTAEEAKSLMLEQLREMFKRTWKRAFPAEGHVDLNGVVRLLDIQKRVAALLGLDAPKEHKILLTDIENELRAAETELEPKLAAEGKSIQEFYEENNVSWIGDAPSVREATG